MADHEWTVQDLAEALKRRPADAKVYYEMGPTKPVRKLHLSFEN